MPRAKDIHHQKGRNTGGKVEQIIQEIPTRHMIIWRTDANGQLRRDSHDKNATRIIGLCAYQKETEKETDNDYIKHANKTA